MLLIASVFLLLMHVSASLLTIAFENISPGAAVILVSMALILPPLTFLGMVPTFLIRKVSASADHAGGSTGLRVRNFFRQRHRRAPVFGFFIIPRYGLTLPSIVTGLAVGAFRSRNSSREKIRIAFAHPRHSVFFLGNQDSAARQRCRGADIFPKDC